MSFLPLPAQAVTRVLGACSCALLLIGAAAPLASAQRTHPWQAPLEGQVEVIRGFEKPAARWSAGHRGVDLTLQAGGNVLAPFEGEIVFAGTVVDRQVLTIEHPDGRLSSFEPVNNPLPLGSQVQAGDVIAQLDPEIQHCAPRFCLHWGVREPATGSKTADRGLDYTNPLLLLGLDGPSVLLPIGDDFAA
ncbi:MAG: M23 family metallopeptidase [Rothia sp. (in: high G+C Gram-positive bacteria)]|nr:M23 family metallopeptidase [Rothia sp. (in: high G+C Gram-positive bacteria)]